MNESSVHAQRGHFERYSEETLRGLNRDKVIEQIAVRETEVEVQQEVVNRLDNLLDTEQRQLWDAERALTRWRDVLAQIDALAEGAEVAAHHADRERSARAAGLELS